MSSRRERAASKGSLATDLAVAGTVVGSPLGPTGSVVGGVVGGLTGLIVGDQTTVFPMDMVAIPAFQAHLLSTQPSFMVFIKEGEVLTQVIETEAQEAMSALQGETKAASKPRRKRNAWITFSKKFEYRKRRKNESAKAYLGARAKAASRAYKKAGKGGTKKGMTRKTARRAYEKKKK